MLQIEKGQDIKQELLQRYKTILPDELMKSLIPQLCWGEWNSWKR
jgi:hypothetical protein